jgi:hypothetical protein
MTVPADEAELSSVLSSADLTAITSLPVNITNFLSYMTGTYYFAIRLVDTMIHILK